MRDKLRAESLKSLDALLLRHYDPNRLKQYRMDRVHYVRDLGAGSFGKVFQGTFNVLRTIHLHPRHCLSSALSNGSCHLILYYSMS